MDAVDTCKPLLHRTFHDSITCHALVTWLVRSWTPSCKQLRCVRVTFASSDSAICLQSCRTPKCQLQGWARRLPLCGACLLLCQIRRLDLSRQCGRGAVLKGPRTAAPQGVVSSLARRAPWRTRARRGLLQRLNRLRLPWRRLRQRLSRGQLPRRLIRRPMQGSRSAREAAQRAPEASPSLPQRCLHRRPRGIPLQRGWQLRLRL